MTTMYPDDMPTIKAKAEKNSPPDAKRDDAVMPDTKPASVASPKDMPRPDFAGKDHKSTFAAPLDSITAEAAENGLVVTHEPQVSDRVKNMDRPEHKPLPHVFSNHADALDHIATHITRLTPSE